MLLHVLVPLNAAWTAISNSTMPQEVLAHQKEETCNCLNLSLADELRDLAVKRIVSEGTRPRLTT